MLNSKATDQGPTSTAPHDGATAPSPEAEVSYTTDQHSPSSDSSFPQFPRLPKELRLSIWRMATTSHELSTPPRWITLTHHTEMDPTSRLTEPVRPAAITVSPWDPSTLNASYEARGETLKLLRRKSQILSLHIAGNVPPLEVPFDYEKDVLYLAGEGATRRADAAQIMKFWSTSSVIPKEQRERVRHLAVGYADNAGLTEQARRNEFCNGLAEFTGLESLTIVTNGRWQGIRKWIYSFENTHGACPGVLFRSILAEVQRTLPNFPWFANFSYVEDHRGFPSEDESDGESTDYGEEDDFYDDGY
ncbi:uncharacterized protein BDZ99DRAFT_274070 [Mytilinidion resinicola]|uniref:2EXR domain-containing protein n=1 Tax=Mytilinidion resinicola TaxID=574789 RepID=A0A6A6YR04_9PEZI|nr:uncharacterized protein BDZ99DRAFT_274070 [Mytilinidion resinicola]KAF2811342.1 hypothetical protein BDZ99DRAFT_274070 [Mytilinidion resinicola]